MRADDKHFLERFPVGPDSIFKILGHTKVREMTGTIVVKVEGDPESDNDGSFQIFIPDKGNKEMAILFRRMKAAQPKWMDMSVAEPADHH